MADLTSRPYKPDPGACCEACVFGRGEHAPNCQAVRCEVCHGPIAPDKCHWNRCRLCIRCAKWHDNPGHPLGIGCQDVACARDLLRWHTSESYHPDVPLPGYLRQYSAQVIAEAERKLLAAAEKHSKLA